MTAIARTLQVIGWLWFAAGIAGPVFGLWDFNLFPGLILIFVSRVLRVQAARRTPTEDLASPTPQAVPERMLNTERNQQTGPPPPPPRSPEPPPLRPRPEADTPKKRNELLEQIVLTGREVAATEPEKVVETPDTEAVDSIIAEAERRQMTSAEMIAEARRRWDRKERSPRSEPDGRHLPG